jgi:hypothetical protein
LVRCSQTRKDGSCYPALPSPFQMTTRRPTVIQLKPESPDELRKRLREISVELRRFGEGARKLSDRAV